MGAKSGRDPNVKIPGTQYGKFLGHPYNRFFQERLSDGTVHPVYENPGRLFVPEGIIKRIFDLKGMYSQVEADFRADQKPGGRNVNMHVRVQQKIR